MCALLSCLVISGITTMDDVSCWYPPLCFSSWMLFRVYGTDEKYVLRNIPGPGCNMEEFETKFDGCVCSQEFCLPDNCSCVKMFGVAYSVEGKIVRQHSYAQEEKEMSVCIPIYECNPNCSCSSKCSNRLVQHGLKFKTKVFPTLSTKGLGLQTLEFIPKGSFLCEYAGEILGIEEAKIRTRSIESQKAMNYILVLKEHYGDKVVQTCVDPTYFGNISRFINHSCQPNLWMTAVRFLNAVPKLSLFALRDINEGEELGFHYGGVVSAYKKTDKDKNVGGNNEKYCTCGSENCCGYLPFDETLFET